MRARVAVSGLALALLAGCTTTQLPPSDGAEARPPRPTPEQADPERRAQVRMELASAYFGRGQAQTALHEVQQALVAKPDMPEAYNLLGLIYASLGDTAQADDSFQRALRLAPQSGGTMHNYGWFLCQQRRFADADAQFRAALALPQYRDGARTLLAEGVCQARNGQWADAERLLSRSFELDPANPATAYNLADVLYVRGEFERARFYIRRVNATNALSNAQSLWLAARVERRLGNTAGVQDLGRQLRDRFPDAPETLRFEQGRFDE